MILLLALALAGPLVFVTNERDGTISVIDSRSDTLAGTIKVGDRPRGIQSHGGRIYVAVSDQLRRKVNDVDRIAVLDAATHQPVKTYKAGVDPEQLAVSPDGSHLFVANEDAGLASIIDTRTGRAIAELEVGLEPEGVAVSPDGRWLYVTGESSSTVTIIDTAARKVIAHLLVGSRPRGVAFTSDGALALITSELGRSLTLIDAKRHQIVKSIQIPNPNAKPVGIAIAPGNRVAYIATGRANAVAVLDLAAQKFTAEIPVGERCWGLALLPDGSKLYVANNLSNNISVIDTAQLKVIKTIPAGNGPWGVAISAGKR
jgi:PQQ-dependent catabolism-associated beta-propeller protein